MRASKPGMDSRILIGLCNPGEEYSKTYHNIGGLFIDYLASSLDVRLKKTRRFEYARHGGLIVVKSASYMNQSGATVAAALKYFETPPQELLVVHDDSDLTVGNYRLSVGQNPAGHHGVESVIGSLRTKDFYRLRIGVRPVSEAKRRKAGDFVLHKINGKDYALVEAVFDRALTELRRTFLKGYIEPKRI